LRPTLEETTRRLGLDRSVRFLGLHEDVEGVLAAADVLVHPSLEEGFSNAILEAMGASLPVIATRVGGNPEAVEDGVTGLLVPPRDSPALARATIGVLADPARASALGAAGRRRVEQEFTLSRMVARYEQVYAEMVGQT
jgi:glycosyltransferase involved in cell wall biosynthesis